MKSRCAVSARHMCGFRTAAKVRRLLCQASPGVSNNSLTEMTTDVLFKTKPAGSMKSPLFVRELNESECEALRAALRSKDSFTVRRGQILLASAGGLRPSRIAHTFGCSAASVRNALHAFASEGLACLHQKSCRPQSSCSSLSQTYADSLKDLLHESPRRWGQESKHWTLDGIARVCMQLGWTPRRLTGEGIRLALKRLGIAWRRGKYPPAAAPGARRQRRALLTSPP
jgi:transposase